MNLMMLFRQHKSMREDVDSLLTTCKLLDETTAALAERVKSLEAARNQGEAHGSEAIPVKRGRGRPRKAVSGD